MLVCTRGAAIEMDWWLFYLNCLLAVIWVSSFTVSLVDVADY